MDGVERQYGYSFVRNCGTKLKALEQYENTSMTIGVFQVPVE